MSAQIPYAWPLWVLRVPITRIASLAIAITRNLEVQLRKFVRTTLVEPAATKTQAAQTISARKAPNALPFTQTHRFAPSRMVLSARMTISAFISTARKTNAQQVICFIMMEYLT
jgi:hypothetical protein